MITYSVNNYGLRQKDMDYMFRIFDNIPGIEKVILYGSRATGGFKKGADVDLAVVGEGVTTSNIARIHFLLENESPTFLWFDVLHYDTLKSDTLKNEIDTFGKVLYTRI